MLLQRWSLLILCCFILVSCSDDSDNPAGLRQVLRVNPSSRSVANSNDSTSFDIIASGPWSVSESVDWIWTQPNAGEGSGRVTVHF